MRHEADDRYTYTADFNPRTSYEVRRTAKICQAGHGLFQSTHLLRGATSRLGSMTGMRRYFNPRTSYEVRQTMANVKGGIIQFQSTHLLRGATSGDCASKSGLRYFNPRTSYEVRLLTHGFNPWIRYFNPRTSYEVRHFMLRIIFALVISIHAPLTRCDTKNMNTHWMCFIFQSTHLLRGATGGDIGKVHEHIFQSTHLLRGATRHNPPYQSKL